MIKKIVFFVVCIFVISAIPLVSQESSSFSCGFQPMFQYRKTRIGEYVFTKLGKSTALLSDLQWKLSHVFLAGGSLQISKNKYTASLCGLAAFPGKSGSMTDADFYTDDPLPSLFSSHSSSITRLLDFCATLAYEPIQAEKISIQCFTSLQYAETSASAYGGYQINNLNQKTAYFSGKVISYTQYLLFAWLGSHWKVYPIKPLCINFSMAYAPYCFAKGWDVHHLRSIEFLDRMNAFYALKGGISLSLSTTKALSLGIGTEGLFLPVVKGVTGSKNEGELVFLEKTHVLGGTSISEARFYAALSYIFTK